MLYKKKMDKNLRLIFSILALVFIFLPISCKKYLDKKPKQNLTIPSSVSDLQALLDNLRANQSPGYLEFVADNYYLSSGILSTSNLEDQANYVWDKDARTPDNSTWTAPYEAIYNSNFVLDYLPKINFSESERDAYNNVMGTALFYRSFLFHQLAQLFCQPYSANTETDAGIVLRLTSAIEAPVTRSTVKQTYEQIINDLKTATALLPVNGLLPTRPSKAAAYGELARVYLSMRDYVQAGLYADSCLQLKNELLDYKIIAGLPDFRNNPEILFYNYEGYRPLAWGPNCNIDTILYQQYSTNDRRKELFFEGTGNAHYWKGSYISSINYLVFPGMAIDEVYLIRAECRARAGDKDRALADLNTLLRKRISGFIDISAATNAEALTIILTERRKELLCRGLRWSDLRRFNLEGANITLKRIIDGTAYTLPPNDLRWVLLIPDIEINRSGIAQNPR